MRFVIATNRVVTGIVHIRAKFTEAERRFVYPHSKKADAENITGKVGGKRVPGSERFRNRAHGSPRSGAKG